MRVQEFFEEMRVDQPGRVAEAEEELERCEAKVNGAMPGGDTERRYHSYPQSVPPILLKLENAREQVRQERETLARMQTDAEKMINSIPKADWRITLRCRYIERMSWRAIQAVMKKKGTTRTLRMLYMYRRKGMGWIVKTYGKEIKL